MHVKVRGLWRSGEELVFPKSSNFSKHSDNLNAIDKSLIQIERAHKRAIRENDQPALVTMRRIHLLLVGMRAEASLRKIIEDPTGFGDSDRSLIWEKRTQQDRWVEVVERAARRHYQVPEEVNIAEGVPDFIWIRIAELIDLIRGDLSPVITDRNRLAHGQWIWQLKSQSDHQFKKNQEKFDFNYYEIDCRNRILKNIYLVVNVLAVSEPTFGRDFTKIVSRIREDKKLISGAGYEEYAASLRQSALKSGLRGN